MPWKGPIEVERTNKGRARQKGSYHRGCQFTAHSRGPGGDNDVSGLLLYGTLPSHKPILPATTCLEVLSAGGCPGWRPTRRSRENQARKERGTGGTKANLLSAWESVLVRTKSWIRNSLFSTKLWRIFCSTSCTTAVIMGDILWLLQSAFLPSCQEGKPGSLPDSPPFRSFCG